MKYVKMATCGVLVGLVLMMPFSGVALDDQEGKTRRQAVEPQSQPAAATANLPVYVPPLRSAPGGRVGGSTRGAGVMPILSALAPDHTGLTVQEQPALFWYLAGTSPYPVELTITDDRSPQPLFETRIVAPIQAGIQRIRLAEAGVHLSKGVPYRWAVALVVDPASPSRDNIAGGTIERVEIPKGLRAKLKQAGKPQTPSIYAQAGLWYDALTSIADLLEAAPNDPALRQQQTALLEQVGLRQIAEHNMRRSHAP
jgi:Domain of Unknown Function (DUF928)